VSAAAESVPPLAPWLPDDAHGAAARRLAAQIARAFPGAGIAVSGSVSRGEHEPDSDLDVVVADRAFRRSAQFARQVDGIRAAVVCLSPAATPGRVRRWAMAATHDAGVLVSMVRSARVVVDPAGAFGELLACVEAGDAMRAADADALLADYRAQADRLLHSADLPGLRQHHLVHLATVLVDAWTLARGRREDTKRDARGTFTALRDQDPALYSHLRAAIPITTASVGPLRAAYRLIFGAEPPA
jgi:hypothetical protein